MTWSGDDEHLIDLTNVMFGAFLSAFLGVKLAGDTLEDSQIFFSLWNLFVIVLVMFCFRKMAQHRRGNLSGGIWFFRTTFAFGLIGSIGIAEWTIGAGNIFAMLMAMWLGTQALMIWYGPETALGKENEDN